MKTMQEAPASASFYRPYARLKDFLPNVRFTHPSAPGEASAPTDSVIVGRVTDVVTDRGFIETTRPGTAGKPGARITTFNDPEAWWRTVKVTVSVDEVIAGPRLQPLVLDLPLMGSVAAGDSADNVAKGLKDLGTVVVFSRALPTGPEFLGLKRELPDRPFGLAQVDAGGGLSFPFAASEGTSSSDFMEGVDTLAELRAEAAKPVRSQTAPD